MAFFQTEKVIYIVTERVQPLEIYVKNNIHREKQNELAISWGLHQVAVSINLLYYRSDNLGHTETRFSSYQ